MQVMTPLKNLKKWRVIQANTLPWLSSAQNRGRGSIKTSRRYNYTPNSLNGATGLLGGFSDVLEKSKRENHTRKRAALLYPNNTKPH